MTQEQIQSPPGPDLLAGALLRQLACGPMGGGIGGAFWGLIFAALTFGVGPAVVWGWQLKRLIRSERIQWEQMAEWLGRRGVDSVELKRAVRRLRFRLSLWLLGLIAVMGVCAEVGYTAYQSRWDGEDVVEALYRWPARDWTNIRALGTVHGVWLAGMTVGFLLQWFQVQLHGRDLRRVARVFDPLVAGMGLPQTGRPRIWLGLRTGWLLAGGVLCWMGAWWGIGFALAGGAQTLLNQRIFRMRTGLGEVLRLMLQQGRAVTGKAVLMRRRCGNEKCREYMPDVARYCPRCGRGAG